MKRRNRTCGLSIEETKLPKKKIQDRDIDALHYISVMYLHTCLPVHEIDMFGKQGSRFLPI